MLKTTSVIIRFIFYISLFTLISCKNEPKKERELSEIDKQTIKTFASNLTESINKYEYDLTRNSWNSDLFKNRVNNLTKAEQTVFNHFYNKNLSKTIMLENINLINKLKNNNGKINLSKVVYFPSHAEILYSMAYSTEDADCVDFWKFRVELSNNIPMISDYYSYRDEIWQSQNVQNILRLSSQYTATSEERHQVNRSLMNSENYLLDGDSLNALIELFEIPESHLIGNALSLMRINLAYQLADSIFVNTLETERELNNSLYIKYLYGYYFNDTLELNEVYRKLDSEIGSYNAHLDSLKTSNHFWN